MSMPTFRMVQMRLRKVTYPVDDEGAEQVKSTHVGAALWRVASLLYLPDTMCKQFSHKVSVRIERWNTSNPGRRLC